MNVKAFTKNALKHGVADHDVASAYQVYKAIAVKDNVEVTSIYTGEGFTHGDVQKGSRVGQDPNYERPKTLNGNYFDFLQDVKDRPGVDQQLSDDLFQRNEYKADIKGNGYVIFGDYDIGNRGNKETPMGHILIDGSNSQPNSEELSVLQALSRLQLD